MISTTELLKQILNTIDDITDKFYKQKEQEAYRLLNQSLDLISQIMERLLTNNTNEEVSIQLQEIIKYLDEALQAMEAKDSILLADILQYELRERFQAVLVTANDK